MEQIEASSDIFIKEHLVSDLVKGVVNINYIDFVDGLLKLLLYTIIVR